MTKATILLAEDDNYSAKLINDFLSVHDYNVICFTDGISVLEEAKNFRFDLALLDLRLPGKNGFLITEYFRQQPIISAVPIIITSAFTDQQNKLRAYEAGANYFLCKPINTKELIYIINNLLVQQQQKMFVLQSQINDLIEEHQGRQGHTALVIQHCQEFAEILGIIHENRNRLLTAATFHDLGHIDCQNTKQHIQLGVRIATKMGLEQDIITLIAHHHQTGPEASNNMPSHLKTLIKIIQTAEKIEEVYLTNPEAFQEDLKKGWIQPEFSSYISNYLSQHKGKNYRDD